MADRSYRKHWRECGQECAGDCWSQPPAPSPQASTQPPPIPREECEDNVPGSGTSRKPLIEYPRYTVSANVLTMRACVWRPEVIGHLIF